MRIGEDYDKIAFEFLGLDLVEPNAFIGDTLLFIVALYLAYKTKKLNDNLPFFKNWRWFYIAFGISFFLGGFGHLFYNYLGVLGKIGPWYLGIVASFLIERGMVSIHKNTTFRRYANRFVIAKLIISLVSMTIVLLTVDLTINPTVGIIVPTVNSTIGLFFALGYLGVIYSITISSKFKYLWISVLVMLPSVFFLAMKISFHQWFDRNDLSHLLLMTGMVFYFLSIKGYSEHLKVRIND